MPDPIRLGQESQLFIDDYCLGRLCGTRRCFHQAKKHPANPLLTPEGWENGIQVYGNALYDPEMGLYRMWYNAWYGAERHGGDKFAVCHATSADGIAWERTRLNRIEHDGVVLTNAVLRGYRRGPTVFLTPDDPDPGRRYRMFVHTGHDDVTGKGRKLSFNAAYSVYFSPDGLEWTPYEGNPVMQGGDIGTCMYDPVTGDYLAFPKIHTMCVGEESRPIVDADRSVVFPATSRPLAKWRRCVGMSSSKDFVTWETPQIHLSADAIDDARVPARLARFRNFILYDDPEYYSADMQGMTGFRHEGLRLGLIWFYDRCGLRPEEYGNNDDGILNIQLAYSRDRDPLGFWHRAGERYDFIPCGVEGDHDSAMIFAAHTVLERDDELWFYYTGYSQSHGNHGGTWRMNEPNACLSRRPILPSSINVATLRRGGFASIEALYPGGSMTTKLLTFEGQRLLINADAKRGAIQVELTDPEGKPIAGYTKEQSIPFSSDEIRGEIGWKSGKRVGALQGQPVQVVFHIKTARLYSFRFCD